MSLLGRKDDVGKLRLSLLPAAPLIEVARVLEYGAKKYGDRSWMYLENAQERYTDALMRHLFARQMGERFDPESKLLHAAHIATNGLFLTYFEGLCGK